MPSKSGDVTLTRGTKGGATTIVARTTLLVDTLFLGSLRTNSGGMVYTPAKDRIVVHSDRNQNGGEKKPNYNDYTAESKKLSTKIVDKCRPR
jgi:hypothetical protein